MAGKGRVTMRKVDGGVHLDRDYYAKLLEAEAFVDQIPQHMKPPPGISFNIWFSTVVAAENERVKRLAMGDSQSFAYERLPDPDPPTSTSITSERQPTYGHPSLNFARQALVWTGLLANKLLKPITVQEVAIMMAGVKLARLMESPDHEDSIIDVGGYMSCLEQVTKAAAFGLDGTGIQEDTVARMKAADCLFDSSMETKR